MEEQGNSGRPDNFAGELDMAVARSISIAIPQMHFNQLKSANKFEPQNLEEWGVDTEIEEPGNTGRTHTRSKLSNLMRLTLLDLQQPIVEPAEKGNAPRSNT